jgi:hypothetical protein
MAIQWATATGTTSPIEYRYPPSAGRQQVQVPRARTTVAQQIEDLPNDYRRAVFCREHAEGFRRQWFAGMSRETAYVVQRADGGDPRFRAMTPGQLEMTARWRWSQSARARYFMELESVFTGWAQMYLSFAEVEVLSRYDGPPQAS